MSDRLRDYEEKRDFIRMNLNSEATLYVNGQSHAAICIDLSSTGMQLKTTCKLEPGQQVKVEIGSRHSSLSGLSATARVIRCSPAEDAESSILGLKIEQMS